MQNGQFLAILFARFIIIIHETNDLIFQTPKIKISSPYFSFSSFLLKVPKPYGINRCGLKSFFLIAYFILGLLIHIIAIDSYVVIVDDNLFDSSDSMGLEDVSIEGGLLKLV